MAHRLIVIASIVLLAAAGALADGYRIDWMVFSSGGGSTAGASFTMRSTFGQPAAGYVVGGTFRHWIGFWFGGGLGGPDPIPCAAVTDAKMYADGTLVSLSGKAVGSSVGDFPDFFYVEEEDRSSGIRIAMPPPGDVGRWSIVSVTGTLSTTLSGERQLVAPLVMVVSFRNPLGPLGMTNRTVGGGTFGTPPWGQHGVPGGVGVNNVGLLIRTWGWIVASGAGYLIVDDGSGTPVRVDTGRLTQPPVQGYIGVTGISSLYKAAGFDRVRLILPRNDSDVICF